MTYHLTQALCLQPGLLTHLLAPEDDMKDNRAGWASSCS